jgi:hypothetical protein
VPAGCGTGLRRTIGLAAVTLISGRAVASWDSAAAVKPGSSTTAALEARRIDFGVGNDMADS